MRGINLINKVSGFNATLSYISLLPSHAPPTADAAHWLLNRKFVEVIDSKRKQNTLLLLYFISHNNRSGSRIKGYIIVTVLRPEDHADFSINILVYEL